MKIAIIGHSGAGKSTLARQLAENYSIEVLHLDTVNFLPNWQERPEEESLEIVAEFMQKESWIIEGNYRAFYQKERMEQADEIVFLNFNRFTCLHRAIKRARKYKHGTRPDMAEGCAEKMDGEFAWWVFCKGRNRKRRKHYNSIVKQYNEKTTVLKNTKQVKNYLEKIKLHTNEVQ